MSQDDNEPESLELLEEYDREVKGINYNSPQKAPLYIVTIELTEGNPVELSIFEDSVPEKLASEFCNLHSLNFQAKEFLITEITRLMNQGQNSLPIERQCIEEELLEESQGNHLESNSIEPKTRNLQNSKPAKKHSSDSCEQPLKSYELKYDESSVVLVKEKSIEVASSIVLKNERESPSSNSPVKLFSYQLIENQNMHPNLKTRDYTAKKPVNLNVFNKLYKDAEIKRKFPRRKSRDTIGLLSNPSESLLLHSKLNEAYSGYANPGERMYRQNLRLKEEKSKKLNELRIENEIKSTKECTFRPKLSQNTDIDIPKHKIKKHFNEEVMHINHYKQQRIENTKKKHKICENEYTFTPNASGKRLQSARTDKRPNLHEDKHEQLYLDYKKREKYREEHIVDYFKDFSFKPKCNIKKQLAPPGDFFERQNLFLLNKAEKIKTLADSVKPLKDSCTGQQFFKPLISEYSKNYRRKSPALMYNYSKLFNSNREMREKFKEENIRAESAQVFASKRNESIFNKAKKTAFESLFSMLDQDGDLIISVYTVDFAKIPLKLCKILEPLTNMLKAHQESIAKQDFVSIMEYIYDQLSHEDKNYLLKYNRQQELKRKSNCDFSFKPKINEHSKQLAGSKSLAGLKLSQSTAFGFSGNNFFKTSFINSARSKESFRNSKNS